MRPEYAAPPHPSGLHDSETPCSGPHDPGPEEAGRQVAALPPPGSAPLDLGNGSHLRAGTAGWTDPTLTARGVFYPADADSAEERLRHYASVFPLVEIDSTYYSLPVRRNAALWLDRTPPGFCFDVKAHALMTGQPTEVERLPRSIRDALPPNLAQEKRLYGKDLPPALYDQVWELFRDGVAPLHEAGKLGSVLLQYPRWFHPSSRSREEILDARERLGDMACAVEFRNASWFTGDGTAKTLQFLEEHRIPFVMVDGPQGTGSSIPPMVAVTSPDLAIVRFHGRRSETWEARGIGVAERFRYFYDTKELEEWSPRVLQAASQAREVHVVMNNCYANYGVANAIEFVHLIRESLQKNSTEA